MDYSVGSRIRVRLYSGKVVEAEITAITNQSAGRKGLAAAEKISTLLPVAAVLLRGSIK